MIALVHILHKPYIHMRACVRACACYTHTHTHTHTHTDLYPRPVYPSLAGYKH